MLLAPVQGGGWTAAQAGALEAATLLGRDRLCRLPGRSCSSPCSAVVSIPAVRRPLTPGFVEDRARPRPRARTVRPPPPCRPRADRLLIYASTAERRLEIVADEDIHAKVGEAYWSRGDQGGEPPGISRRRSPPPSRGLDPRPASRSSRGKRGRWRPEHSFPSGGTAGPRPREPTDDLSSGEWPVSRSRPAALASRRSPPAPLREGLPRATGR